MNILFYVSILSALDVKFKFLMSWVKLTQFLVELSHVKLKIWATQLELSWKCEQLNLILIQIQNVNSKLNLIISLLVHDFLLFSFSHKFDLLFKELKYWRCNQDKILYSHSIIHAYFNEHLNRCDIMTKTSF